MNIAPTHNPCFENSVSSYKRKLPKAIAEKQKNKTKKANKQKNTQKTAMIDNTHLLQYNHVMRVFIFLFSQATP